MKIAIIGTGYVGLPTGVGLAELGNTVVCVDKIKDKIEMLNAGKLTIFEAGLEDLFLKNIKNGRLKFSVSMEDGVKNADVVLIAVGTPPHPVTKEADLSYIYAAAEEMAQYLKGYTVVATKSTVPVGTGDEVEKIIRDNNPSAEFDVVSLPEFLREGFAIHDFFEPDRIVIGVEGNKPRMVMAELYKPFTEKTQILFVKRRSAETIKYASNAFLAIKIHYINEMADFCEKAGADIFEVAKGMGLDRRIGNKFLNPGPGYGGSCFPKDTNAMACMGRKYGASLSLIEAAIRGNDLRKTKMAERILNMVKGVSEAKVAVWGLAFKNGTDDVRCSPALQIVEQMLRSGANICVYDPKAMDNARKILGDEVKYAQNAFEAAQDADVLAVLTEWNDFAEVNLTELKAIMRSPKIVDLRNMLKSKQPQLQGFEYRCIGMDS